MLSITVVQCIQYTVACSSMQYYAVYTVMQLMYILQYTVLQHELAELSELLSMLN